LTWKVREPTKMSIFIQFSALSIQLQKNSAQPSIRLKLVEGANKGKALKICGDAIAATANSCGETTFERKANYWLANDYYRKAAASGADVSTSKIPG
jgi:hypothetical protein